MQNIDSLAELLSKAQNYRRLALHCADRLTVKELITLAEDYTALANEEAKKAALQRADRRHDGHLRLVSSLPSWPTALFA
jgi:hypothetical protein